MSTATGRWQRLRALFDELVELPPPEQATRLDELTRDEPALQSELASLLAAERSAGERFERAPTLFDDGDLPDLDAIPSGTRIGPYRVIRELGRGGMGAVYEAVRDDAGFTKRVALKMVVGGRDTEAILRRFRSERQILARLEHKNIAALVDGGVSADGRPWFAMEYVEGERIDRYCAQERLGIRARLQLMRQVCAAVHYAHRNLVIHRDLKPGNILVGPDGTVKLLDFGIAKLMDPVTGDDGLTETGVLPMTTRYASPEQLRGDPVTTASDIYSLGVVLYELVAGRPLFQFGDLPILEVRRRMLDEAPPPPSTVAQPAPGGERLPRAMAGELDHLVLMALRKEPERRYASAEQLSEDLQRLLSGLPIQAQPDSFGYRLRKFAARNRAAVLAVGIVFLTLAGGLLFSLRQSRSVQRERARAEAVSQFLQDLLSASSPDIAVGESRSDDRTVRDVLDAAAGRLASEDLAGQPEVKAALQRIIGTSYLSTGSYREAERNLRAAYAIQRDLYGEDHPELLATMLGLGQLALRQADYPRADSLFSRRLDVVRRQHQRGRVATDLLFTALSDFALLRRARGNPEAAERLLREAFALGPLLTPAERGRIATLESILVLALLDQGKFAEAEAEARRIVATVRDRAQDSPDLCPSLTILGSVLMEAGKLAEAEASLREAEALYRRFYDSNYVATYDNVRLQAQTLLGLGRLPEAEERINQTLANYRRFLRPQYISYATALTVQGLILFKRGRTDSAERVLREGHRLRRDNLPPDHFMAALTAGALGEVLTGRGKYAEAESLLVRSYANLRASQASGNLRTESARQRLVALYTASGRPDELARLP